MESLSSGDSAGDQPQISLAYLPPTRRQARVALAGATVLLLGLAVLLPFSAEPLPKVVGFIPAVDAIISVTDLITAGLLLAHFSITRSRALWALACGYLFSAAIVVAHGLTFPGVITPTGNLGGSNHTNFRVYLLWHLGLPVALFAYVWLRNKHYTKVGAHISAEIAATVGGVGVLALVSCIAFLALLPPVDPVAGRWLTGITMLICAGALSALWIFQRSVLDLWLMVVVLAMIVELTITALVGGRGPSTFTLGFYTGRLFSLVTSTVVLIALLAETTRLYAAVANANLLARALKAEAELAHANRVATMGELAASIAHEVNHPIAATIMNAGTALRWLAASPPELERAKQSIGRIMTDSKRGADIIARLRDLVKKAPAKKDALEINEAILEVMRLTHAAMIEHGVVARTQLSEGLPHILGDRVQLQQVILNLTMNAVEAMGEVAVESRELLISTGRVEPDGILVSVGDSGPGLPAASSARIFEAFYTTKASGLGMGLSICRSIVEAHGGRLWAAPNEPRGAVFCMMLPVGERSFGDLAASQA